MNYEEMFDRAEQEGRIDFNSIEIVKWEDEGQQLTGELIAIEIFEGNRYNDQCNKYMLRTDSGIVSFILGAATDNRLQDVTEGMIIRVIYKGQKDLKDGKRVNVFDVKSIKQPE